MFGAGILDSCIISLVSDCDAYHCLSTLMHPFNRCPYCATKLSYDQSRLDHIHQLSQGGLSEDDNLVLICAPCNTSEGVKILRAFCRDAGLSYDLVIGRLEMIGKAV